MNGLTDEFEVFIYSALNAYRVTTLLGTLIETGHKTADIHERYLAFTNLLDIFKKAMPTLRIRDVSQFLEKFLSENTNQINYAISDMHFYACKHFQDPLDEKHIEKNRLEIYYPKMCLERVKFLSWDIQKFKLLSEEPKILDLGCGLLPFLDILDVANKGKIKEYIGVDKRCITDFFEIDSNRKMKISDYGYPINLIVSEIDNFIESESGYLKECDTILLFEVLHCIFNSTVLVSKMFRKLANLKQILILEPILNNKGISLAFTSHMLKHCNASIVDDEFLEQVKTVTARPFTISTTFPNKQYRLVSISI